MLNIYTLLDKLRPSFKTGVKEQLEVSQHQLMITQLSRLEEEHFIKRMLSAGSSHIKIKTLYENIQEYSKSIVYFNKQMRNNLPISFDKVKSSEIETTLGDFYVDKATGRFILPKEADQFFTSVVGEFLFLRERSPDMFVKENEKQIHFRNFSNTQWAYDDLKKLAYVVTEL